LLLSHLAVWPHQMWQIGIVGGLTLQIAAALWNVWTM
jgi:hypothetical protein